MQTWIRKTNEDAQIYIFLIRHRLISSLLENNLYELVKQLITWYWELSVPVAVPNLFLIKTDMDVQGSLPLPGRHILRHWCLTTWRWGKQEKLGSSWILCYPSTDWRIFVRIFFWKLYMLLWICHKCDVPENAKANLCSTAYLPSICEEFTKIWTKIIAGYMHMKKIFFLMDV
jgi:hypothetical protein